MKKLLFTLLAISLLTAAFSQSKNQMSKRLDESSIPKDVLNKEYTLLVKIPYDSKTWVRKFTKVMEEHYTGKFEIVPYKASVDENYGDAKKYRYILSVSNSLSGHDFSGVTQKTSFNPTGSGSIKVVRSALYIVDREDGGKTYDSGLAAQDIMKIVAFYADKLSGN
jgi:hypothetical protein